MYVIRSLAVVLFLCSVAVAQTGAQDSTTLEPTETAQAIYPDAAVKGGVRGHVLVEILVSENGSVEATKVLRGDAALDDAAEAAAKKWKFKPFLKSGTPVAAVAVLNFDFENGVTVAIEHPGPMPSKLRISSGVTNELQIRKVSPTYPEGAKRKHIQGAVVMAATIGKDGTIKDIKVITGPAELRNAAVEAARQWLFKPYFFLGRPVEVETQITMNFTLGS